MIKPMLAKAVGDQVPTTPGLLYEPKWDGFRCLVFRDEQVILQSRKEEDFSYLFPEVVAACQNLPAGTTLDGELVIVGDSGLEFDLLSNRIRPRSEAGGWKIQELSQATPAQYVAFDVLRWQGEDVSQRPFAERRQILEESTCRPACTSPPSLTTQRSLRSGSTSSRVPGSTGSCASRRTSPTPPENGRCSRSSMCAPPTSWLPAGDRTRMRPRRIADARSPAARSVRRGGNLAQRRRGRCVQQGEPDRSGQGTSRPRDRPRRRSPVEMGASEGQRVPGMQSRWTGKKDLGFHPLRPILVAEVKYDHMQGDRFRHVASFVRWRPDREPSSCTYEQLERPVRFDVASVLQGEVG